MAVARPGERLDRPDLRTLQSELRRGLAGSALLVWQAPAAPIQKSSTFAQ